MLNLIFLSLIPLAIFLLFKTISGLNAGVYSGIAASILLFLILKIGFDVFDEQLIIMAVLMAILGLVTIKKNDELYFKLQPFFSELIMVSILAFNYFNNTPWTISMLPEMSKILSGEEKIMFEQIQTNPLAISAMIRMENWMTVWLTVHMFLVGYAARFCSSKIWFITKAITPIFLLLSIGLSDYLYRFFIN